MIKVKKDDPMQQLKLFLPPVAPTHPLPDDARNKARYLLCDLLIAVMTGTANPQQLPEKREAKSNE